jgi:predicted helicase
VLRCGPGEACLSRQLINEYRAELDRLRAISGSRRESVLREAFKDLLKRWGRANDLQFIAEHDILTKQMTRIYVDGALLHGLRVPFGYWEAKDQNDDLAAEIEAKFRKGYPKDNIVFTDDVTAVLYQNGGEVMRAAMQADDDSLFKLLTCFFAHERQEIADFNKAVKQFATDLPHILAALRDRIAEKNAQSADFATAVQAFLQHARDAINPAVSEDDVREMLIQHILTEDIFAKVFDDPDFHRKNNVAAELYKLEDKLFAGREKAELLRALAPYYSGIASTAALIQNHSEKQGFLKALYEDFYKAYNRKAADRLGVVYTPGEIVRFMIRSADWLCEKHFGKSLIDRGVEILDPATGTGTFIVELLEHFRGNHDKLRHKYKEELHANEVAILPYYVANLNIEATYQAITGQFAEFENLCFVDTLDNVDALGIHIGHQFDLLGTLSDQNIERIKRQNRRKISVIIGNPPYNANQQNENDNNKNRTYAHIDKRIKDTYAKRRSSHKTKIYDMYVRFLRWASDRVHSDGIVAFVLNRSFIDKRAFDGLRIVLAEDFQDIYVIDFGGDSRDDDNNDTDVFGNRIGTAILLLVRRKEKQPTAVRIARVTGSEPAAKLARLTNLDLETSEFQRIKKPAAGEWLEIDDVGFSNGLPLVASKLSGSTKERRDPAIFSLSSFGAVSNRDEWAYDRSSETLAAKVDFYISVYSETLAKLPTQRNADISEYLDYRIKWAADLRGYAASRAPLKFEPARIIQTLYRPYTKRGHYFSRDLNWSLYKMPDFFPDGLAGNNAIFFTDRGGRSPFSTLATDIVGDLHLCASADGFQAVARFRYTKSGERVDNITDWALNKFVGHYGKKGVSKDAIFHYVYAVLHDPIYRETYKLNLKREFPRIPFYPEFARWVAWGEALMAMHIGYEEVEPWGVERIDTPNPKRAEGTHPKPILKSVPEQGLVRVDEDTQITGIPPEAWDYRLGNRSAIDWVLDQHKEKTPRDPTVRAKFNTYRFAEYKESMIALLAKVVRVSVETVAITEAMRALDRGK